MSVLATNLTPILANDSIVIGQCSNRVFGYDIRTAGPDSHGPSDTIPTVSDKGFQLCTICVDDQGGVPPPFAPLGAEQDRIVVWILDEWSAAGRARIDLLAARVKVLLHLYQEPSSKAMVRWTGRLGIQRDPIPDTGALDQVTFAASRIPTGIRS